MLYVFPRDYRSKLATKSLRIQIEPFLDKAKVLLSFLAYDLFEIECYLSSSEVFVMLLAGCCGLPDSCFVWDGTYCVYCYCLHFNYTLAFKQKVFELLVYNGIDLSCALTFWVLLKSEDDNRQRRRGRGYDSGFNFYFNPVDLFW